MASSSADASAAAAARKLEGKVAPITGGASGIGACTARLFVRHGASVVVDVQDEAGARLCAELGEEGASICYVRCDVTVESDVAAAVDHAVARFGKLDVGMAIWTRGSGTRRVPHPSGAGLGAVLHSRVYPHPTRGGSERGCGFHSSPAGAQRAPVILKSAHPHFSGL